MNMPTSKPNGLLTGLQTGFSFSVDIMRTSSNVCHSWIEHSWSRGRNTLHARWITLNSRIFICDKLLAGAISPKSEGNLDEPTHHWAEASVTRILVERGASKHVPLHTWSGSFHQFSKQKISCGTMTNMFMWYLQLIQWFQNTFAWSVGKPGKLHHIGTLYCMS